MTERTFPLSWNTDMSDRNAVIDKVRDHLVAQGRQANRVRVQGTKVRCSYLTEAGHKCAVGVLLNDVPSYGNYDHYSVVGLVNEGYVADPGSTVLLLERLQTIHDNEDSWGPKGLTQEALNSIESLRHLRV